MQADFTNLLTNAGLITHILDCCYFSLVADVTRQISTRAGVSTEKYPSKEKLKYGFSVLC